MTLQYVKDSGKGIDVLYNKVVEAANNARECYAEGSTQEFDDEAFARMMFLDGCFILQFMYRIAKNKREDMGMKSHTIALVHRDMFKLENQLPFLVLKALMSLRFREDEERDIINIFINHAQALPPLGTLWQERLSVVIPISIWGLEAPQPEPQKYEDQPVQLLELIRVNLDDVPATLEGGPHSGSDCYSYRSSNELRVAGIHLKPGKSNLITVTDALFESTFFGGQLTLTPIIVDDYTKSILLNLVAYETCIDASNDFAVTSYICFMHSLIALEKDVTLLQSRGIINNYLPSDQAVVDVFNEIAKDLVPIPYAYAGVKAAIESHFRNKLKIWMLEWQSSSRP